MEGVTSRTAERDETYEGAILHVTGYAEDSVARVVRAVGLKKSSQSRPDAIRSDPMPTWI